MISRRLVSEPEILMPGLTPPLNLSIRGMVRSFKDFTIDKYSLSTVVARDV